MELSVGAELPQLSRSYDEGMLPQETIRHCMNRMSITAIIVLVAVSAAVLFFLMGSRNPAAHNYDSGNLKQGAMEIDPAKRNLNLIGVLSSAQVALINEFLKSGSKGPMSHILSEHYLELARGTDAKVIYGVVIKSDGSLIGLDVTGGDASKTIVTGMHEIVRNEDAELCRRLLDEIQKVASARPDPPK
jgi:predicted thioesterase